MVLSTWTLRVYEGVYIKSGAGSNYGILEDPGNLGV